MLQRLSFQKFHSDEMSRVFFLRRHGVIDFVDSKNIGMIQSRRGARLSLQPFERKGIVRQFFGQEFQSDASSEFCVFGSIYDSHSSATKTFEDLVMGNRLADHSATV